MLSGDEYDEDFTVTNDRDNDDQLFDAFVDRDEVDVPVDAYEVDPEEYDACERRRCMHAWMYRYLAGPSLDF